MWKSAVVMVSGCAVGGDKREEKERVREVILCEG